MDKQRTQYLPGTPGKNGRCSQIIGNSKIGVSRHLDSSTTTQNGRNHCPVWKTQLFILKIICKVIFWQGLLWERQFEKILFKHGWEKITNWECLFIHREKRIILICVCGWHKIGWKETESWSDVESTQQRSRFERTNIFPGSCILGVHSTTMPK